MRYVIIICLTFGLAQAAPAAEIAAGTALTVRMIDEVDSGRHSAGQSFRGTLDKALVVDGVTVLEKGTAVTARLEEVSEAGRFRGKSMLALALVSFTRDGSPLEIRTFRSVTTGGAPWKRNGAIADGAAAAGGGAFRVLRKAKALRIPPESLVKFTLAYPLSLE
jgi:hypothetical protein